MAGSAALIGFVGFIITGHSWQARFDLLFAGWASLAGAHRSHAAAEEERLDQACIPLLLVASLESAAP